MFFKKKKQTTEVIKKKQAEIKAAKEVIKTYKSKRRSSNNFGRFLDYFIFNRKGQPAKVDYDNPNPVVESIYPKGEPLGKYCRRFNWIHRFFKVMVFLPAIRILYKLMKKRLDTEVENVWYNKNIYIFNQCWKESLDILGKYVNPKLPTSKSYEMTRRMALSIILNDSITKEFINVFMHTVKMRMEEAYKGKKDVYHVFYTDTVSYNPVYFTMVKAIMEQNKHPANVQVENLNKQEKALYEEEQKIKKQRAEVIKQKHMIHMQSQAEEATKKEMAQTVPPKDKSVFEPVPKGSKLEPVPTKEQQTKKK